LDINWRKTIDNVDYNYGRVFELMKNNNQKKPFWKLW